MAMKLEMGEETVLNMTPMIDICFQLVVFFMLTLDMTSKEYVPLTLPFAYHGVEDKDDPADPIQGLKIIVNLTADGKMILKGQDWDLKSDDPAKQTAALKALHRELMLVTAPDALHDTKESDGHSKIAVQVHGDRASLWRYTQWIIATASSRQIKMYKVYFSVKQPAVEAPSAAGP